MPAELPVSLANVGDIMVTTMENRRRSGKVADLVTKHSEMLSKLTRKGRRLSGGRSIVEELEVALNPSFQFTEDADQLNLSAESILDEAEYQWREAYVVSQITNRQRLMNMGRSRLINLIAVRVKNVYTTMHERMSKEIFSTGTDWNGKGIAGLQHIVSDAPAGTTVGGITASDNRNWQNVVMDVSADGEAKTPASVQMYLSRMKTRLIRNSEKPDICVVPRDVWDEFNRGMQGHLRIQDAEMAKLGFEVLRLGNLLVFHDHYCPKDRTYMLNTKYIKLVTHRRQNMSPVFGDRVPVDQNIQIRVWGSMLQMTCSARHMQGVIKWAP